MRNLVQLRRSVRSGRRAATRDTPEDVGGELGLMGALMAERHKDFAPGVAQALLGKIAFARSSGRMGRTASGAGGLGGDIA